MTPLQANIIAMVKTASPDEVRELVEVCSKLALPWENTDTAPTRRSITGAMLCRAQKRHRDMVEADASLAEQGFIVIDPVE